MTIPTMSFHAQRFFLAAFVAVAFAACAFCTDELRVKILTDNPTYSLHSKMVLWVMLENASENQSSCMVTCYGDTRAVWHSTFMTRLVRRFNQLDMTMTC